MAAHTHTRQLIWLASAQLQHAEGQQNASPADFEAWHA